jgi:K+-transporting ATPase KdpF subunit
VRQERVKTRQPSVNAGFCCPATAFTDRVIENIVAGVIALALVTYLAYALVNPDRF